MDHHKYTIAFASDQQIKHRHNKQPSDLVHSSFSFSICFSPSPISDRTYIMSVVACTDEFSIKPFTVAFSKSRRRFRSRKSSQVTMRSSTGSSQM